MVGCPGDVVDRVGLTMRAAEASARVCVVPP